MKVDIKYRVIWGSFAWAITFCHMIYRCFGEFPLEEVNKNWHQSRVFLLASSVVCGGDLLVNCQKSIFHIADPIIGYRNI